METMCPPGYHQNDFVATNTLGNMMYDLTVWHIFVEGGHIAFMIAYKLCSSCLCELLCAVDHL